MHRVVILQEYIPSYRVAFFQGLHDEAAQQGIVLSVASGTPFGAQSSRGDAAEVSFRTSLRQREFTVLGRRLVLRNTRRAIEDADLVILEQARRNFDAYTLVAPRLFRRRPIALWGHGKDYTKPTNLVDRKIQQVLTLRADWFFAYTEGGAEAVAAMGFPRSRITTVQNSIDTVALRETVANVSATAVQSFHRDHNLKGKD